ncbi:aldehyde dehydrogenase (NADP(+)) [Marinomonas rhizomae]|uniref:NADP-dependent aldehyde dehydrogenase n=1 Tax=Marinomonas rhizomae TaxID=491948 RepID=A0A366JGX0_9GAMM|nr:aldehyde dehydrogenase (NADP(+)) [Marinomonas rhizomae]RBP85068.1 NADP-dependent aldehyde dehydrogenase [Marinomonas rhizomae]RNF76180.1 aldehyde dehydrogenase (NADP(+)) [Marinomonas rhizomae]
MSKEHGKNFINGSRSSDGNTVINSYSAFSGEPLNTTFFQATQAEVEAACASANEAFFEFCNFSSSKRAKFLNCIADELDALGDDFVEIVHQETALPYPRINGEKSRTSNQLRLFAELLSRGDFYGARIDTGDPSRQPAPKVDIRQYQIGIGPVAVFGASNFPLAFSTAGGDTAAALAAGCPVVFKAHSGHMKTAEIVAEAIINAAQKTDMPSGVFNMIFGSGVGKALVQNPHIKAVGFTGSLSGGNAICKMASERAEPIPVFAEMSSINPVILNEGAIKNRGKLIAKELADSVVLGTGQFCTNPGLVIAIKSESFSSFIDDLSTEISNKASSVMLNKGTLSSYVSGIETLEKYHGIEVLSRGQSHEGQATPYLFKASSKLLLDSDELLQEEVFGPATVLIEAQDRNELIKCLSAMRGQLTATLISEEDEMAASSDILSLLQHKAGRVLINGYPTGVEVCDSMVHGGPYPATSDSRGTSVGTLAIERFLRPVCFQNYPDHLLPDAIKNSNPLRINRLINGSFTKDSINL